MLVNLTIVRDSQAEAEHHDMEVELGSVVFNNFIFELMNDPDVLRVDIEPAVR